MVQITLCVYIHIYLNICPNSLTLTETFHRISACSENKCYIANFSSIRIKTFSIELKVLIEDVYNKIERHQYQFLLLTFLFFFFIYILFFLLRSDKIFYNYGETYVKD